MRTPSDTSGPSEALEDANKSSSSAFKLTSASIGCFFARRPVFADCERESELNKRQNSMECYTGKRMTWLQKKPSESECIMTVDGAEASY